jgi:hypothetical protein
MAIEVRSDDSNERPFLFQRASEWSDSSKWRALQQAGLNVAHVCGSRSIIAIRCRDHEFCRQLKERQRFLYVAWNISTAPRQGDEKWEELRRHCLEHDIELRPICCCSACGPTRGDLEILAGLDE